jgi:hypothetical protein
MPALDQAALFERNEVSPNAGGRGLHERSQGFNAGVAMLQQEMENLPAAIFRTLCHLHAPKGLIRCAMALT